MMLNKIIKEFKLYLMKSPAEGDTLTIAGKTFEFSKKKDSAKIMIGDNLAETVLAIVLKLRFTNIIVDVIKCRIKKRKGYLLKFNICHNRVVLDEASLRGTA